MKIYRVHEENGRIYLGQQNNSVYINSDPPDVGPYASGYYCIGSPTDVEATCHDPSCFYHSGGSIYTWCNTINGPYDTLEECEASCSSGLNPPIPVSGFGITMESWDTPSLTCQGDQDPYIEWTWQAPVNEDEVDFFLIRRRQLFDASNSGAIFFPGYNSPFEIIDSGLVDAMGTGVGTAVTNFEPFNITYSSGTGDTFSAACEYESGSSFYYDRDLGDTDFYNDLGISKIEFNKQAGPKITFRSSESKSRFADLGADMYLYVNDSGLSSREYYGYHRLAQNRISEATSNTVTYSGTFNLNVTMSGIDDLLEDLENRGSNTFLYIQMDYDTYIGGGLGVPLDLVDNCNLPAVDDIHSPFVIPKWGADLSYRTGDSYTISVPINPACSYHGYQIIPVNKHGQGNQKPNTIDEMSTWESGWVIRGYQDWSVTEENGKLKITWGDGPNLGFKDLCDPGTEYFFNKPTEPCQGLNGPYETSAECGEAALACVSGFQPVTQCYATMTIAHHESSGVLYNMANKDDPNITYTGTTTSAGVVEFDMPPDGWYTFEGGDTFVIITPTGDYYCTKTTSICSASFMPYRAQFAVISGELYDNPQPPFPVPT
jgi:hypothetical protein